MNKDTKAHVALFTANLIYGANYIVAKEVMNGYMDGKIAISNESFGLSVCIERLAFVLAIVWAFHFSVSI